MKLLINLLLGVSLFGLCALPSQAEDPVKGPKVNKTSKNSAKQSGSRSPAASRKPVIKARKPAVKPVTSNTKDVYQQFPRPSNH